MKGVIVQVGHPKSIVLFNNGKIGAIPTPENGHVGMIVTVKFNNLLKILIISTIAVLLLALGIYIGANYFGTQGTSSSDSHHLEPQPTHGTMHGPRRRMMNNWR
ncbi:MAG: hypothetical protein FWG77_02485 [Treponema sp.]|nr:hypothetical protein [Treponema sp.]